MIKHNVHVFSEEWHLTLAESIAIDLISLLKGPVRFVLAKVSTTTHNMCSFHYILHAQKNFLRVYNLPNTPGGLCTGMKQIKTIKSNTYWF